MLVGAFDNQAGYGPMGVKRMHSCHPVASIGYKSPKFRDRPPEVAGREWNSSMVCVRNSACQRPGLVTVELAQCVYRALPHKRVRCRLSREVATIKLRECGVDVVEIERDECRDPLFRVDLDDFEDLRVK